MNLSHRLSNICLALYRGVNQTSLLKQDWAQALFIRSYFLYKKYLEDATARLVKRYPAFFQGGHILDIGANIGYTAYVYSKVISAPYQIYAFEPEEKNIKIFKKVARSYQFEGCAEIIETAVGAHNGEIEIWQNDNHPADHRILTEEFRKRLSGTIKFQKTPVITIDQFLQKRHVPGKIAFIKIDVQGYELPVCEGMKATLAANPDCVVQFEYCPSIMKDMGYQTNDLIHFFKTRNYYFYRIRKDGQLIHLESHHLDQMEKTQEYFDIIASKKGLPELTM